MFFHIKSEDIITLIFHVKNSMSLSFQTYSWVMETRQDRASGSYWEYRLIVQYAVLWNATNANVGLFCHMKSLFTHLILQIFCELSNISCGSDLNSGTQRSIVGNSPLISSLYSLLSCYSQPQLWNAVGVTCDFDVVLSSSDPNSGTQWVWTAKDNIKIAVQTPTLEHNGHCVSFSLINLLICHCVSCSCLPFEIHLSINFHLVPQSNHEKHNQSQTTMFQKGSIMWGSGPGPWQWWPNTCLWKQHWEDLWPRNELLDTVDSRVSEYGTSKAWASCTKCGTHSPRGEPFTNITKWALWPVFMLPPSSDIPCIIYSSQHCLWAQTCRWEPAHNPYLSHWLKEIKSFNSTS